MEILNNEFQKAKIKLEEEAEEKALDLAIKLTYREAERAWKKGFRYLSFNEGQYHLQFEIEEEGKDWEDFYEIHLIIQRFILANYEKSYNIEKKETDKYISYVFRDINDGTITYMNLLFF